MTEEITQYKTAAPKYEDEHEVEQSNYDNYSYVYVDVETDAESPQRPIFAFAYDEESKVGYVGIKEEEIVEVLKEEGRDTIKQWVKEQCGENGVELKDLKYKPHLGEAFLEMILDDIKSWNESDETESKKAIAGHNVFFDLGMLSGCDEELFIDGKLDWNESDGAMSIGKYTLTHKRAGVDGRLYQLYETLQPDFNFTVLDTMTAAKSLQKPSSLDKLAEYYELDNIKVEEEEHGVLNEEYIRYNINDVIVTKQIKENLEHYLVNVMKVHKPIHWIYSPASIAKAKMEQMGYDRVPYTDLAKKLSSWTYYGGQTEALTIAQKIQNDDYTDILSQYPTVSALTNVWCNYMQAEKVSAKEVEPSSVPIANLDELQNLETWEEISKYVVLVDVDVAEIPVRTQMSNKDTTRVYKAKVTDSKLHLHLMDLIGAEISEVECDYEIVKAYEIVPEGKQELESTEIGETTIEAYDDILQKTIEERKEIQKKIGGKNEETRAMKLTANSGYGVSAERITKTLTTQDGEVEKRYDVAGKYYNPHTASTITAGGRLMLSIGEAIANQNNGEMDYCDTDSLIMDSSVSSEVIDWMNEINPYDGAAGELDVLEVEDADVCAECEGAFDKKNEECLYCGHSEYKEVLLENVELVAIDVKKYAIVKNGKIQTVKEHGLGHYDNMRSKKRVVRFWETLLERLGLSEDEWDGLDSEVQNEMVRWQTSASTYRIRKQLSELQKRFVKYGDFIQRTISTVDGDEIVYVGTNLNGQVIEINIDKSEYQVVESIPEENVKVVNDVITEWQMRAVRNSDGRPTVTINNTEKVNKESQGIKLAYENSIDDAMRDVELDTLF